MIKGLLVEQEKILDESSMTGIKCCRILEESKNMTVELKNNLRNASFKNRLIMGGYLFCSHRTDITPKCGTQALVNKLAE